MTTTRIVNPFQYFTEVDGSPLDFGKVYIGTAGMDAEANPKLVYWDKALTVPASQPIQTIAGYLANTGTAATVYTDGDYSITVRNYKDVLVFSASTSVNFAHESDTEAHGATGAVVGTTNVQTLTNKTLTTPIIADLTNMTHTHTSAATGGAITVDKVLVSANDTTAGYLNGKLVAGTNVTLTEGSDGGNETLTITADIGIPGTVEELLDASVSTVISTNTLVDSPSMGAVQTGEIYLVNVWLKATKGATGGSVVMFVVSAGTVTTTPTQTNGESTYAAANDVWYITIPYLIEIVSGGNNLVIEIYASSVGSDSTANATKLTWTRLK